MTLHCDTCEDGIRWSKASGGSPSAKAVCAWLVKGERKVAYWLRYSGRLEPGEAKAIKEGRFNAFWRDLPPTFSEGEWLDAASNLSVRIAAIEPKRGRYRCVIDRVRDFRSEPITHSRIREQLDPKVVTTLDIGADHPVTQPEPPKVPHAIVKNLPSTEQARRRYEQAQAEKRKAEEELSLDERVRRLAATGSPQARRQLRAIEALVKQGEQRTGLRRAS